MTHRQRGGIAYSCCCILMPCLSTIPHHIPLAKKDYCDTSGTSPFVIRTQRPLSHSYSWMCRRLSSASTGQIFSSSSSLASHFLPFYGQREAMRCASEVHKIDCRHFLYIARLLYMSNGQIHSFQFSAYTMTPPSLTIQLFSNDLLTTIICSKFKMGKN